MKKFLTLLSFIFLFSTIHADFADASKTGGKKDKAVQKKAAKGQRLSGANSPNPRISGAGSQAQKHISGK